MATESSGSNPDFKTRIPGLVDDADIREALKVFLYGEPTVANSAAAAGELTATDGTDGLVGHLNSMRTSLTNASVLKSLYSGSPTKGIILASTGSSTPQAVTVGVDSTVLTADSSEATGVAWKNPTDNLLPKTAGGSHPLTGSLNVAYANPKVIFNDTSSTGIGYAEFQSNSVMKWQIGKNATDSFVINKADTTAAFTINSSGTIVSPSISSPTLTGTVTVPTAGILSNTTVAASTAFVGSRFASTNGVENTAFNSAVTPPGIYPGLLHGTNNANGPGGDYWHVLNVEYSGTAGTGNLTQLGLSYSVDSDNTLAMRSRYGGTWSSWQRLATKSYTDSADATKMPLSGGTFSGDVTFFRYATFSNYAYFHYPAHFYNYATTHHAGITSSGNIAANGGLTGSAISLSGAVTAAQGHFGSGSGNGIWTNYIHSSAWGDIIMETNGGGLVVKNNVGTLTPIACAYPSSNDHAATMYYVTAAMYSHLVNYHGSERSLKDNIKPLSVNKKSSFSSLSPKSFLFKPTGEERLGFIAEEVEAAGLRVTEVEVPNKDEDAPKEYVKTLNPMDLIAVLWAKVEEQEKKIVALEKK